MNAPRTGISSGSGTRWTNGRYIRPHVIGTDDLTNLLEPLQEIGRDDTGTTRLAWTPELAEAQAWFVANARAAGLTVETDPAGNLWAVPDVPGPWWAVGSHLDTVRHGGSWDGALGVAAGLAVAARSSVPVAVISFADEEGARFNTPTFGSRALTGRLNIDMVRDRRDADGVALPDALAAAGVEPARISDASRWLGRLRGFVELHIDQSRDVASHRVPLGVVSGLAARTRLRIRIHGRADHAGTTPMNERADALAAAARVIVAGTEPEDLGTLGTATRIEALPNAQSTIASEVRLWLDGRAPDAPALERWIAGVQAAVRSIVLPVEMAVESRSDGVAFDGGVRAALRSACGEGAPEVLCYAGHDAGILAERIPAGMVLVRNPAGISHAPAESINPADAARGATALLEALEALA